MNGRRNCVYYWEEHAPEDCGNVRDGAEPKGILVSSVVGDIVYLFAWRIFQMPRNYNSSNHNRSNLSSEKLCIALAFRCLMPMHQRGWGAQELGRELP